jgi:hypothetical protein
VNLQQAAFASLLGGTNGDGQRTPDTQDDRTHRQNLSAPGARSAASERAIWLSGIVAQTRPAAPRSLGVPTACARFRSPSDVHGRSLDPLAHSSENVWIIEFVPIRFQRIAGVDATAIGLMKVMSELAVTRTGGISWGLMRRCVRGRSVISSPVMSISG